METIHVQIDAAVVHKDLGLGLFLLSRMCSGSPDLQLIRLIFSMIASWWEKPPQCETASPGMWWVLPREFDRNDFSNMSRKGGVFGKASIRQRAFWKKNMLKGYSPK